VGHIANLPEISWDANLPRESALGAASPDLGALKKPRPKKDVFSMKLEISALPSRELAHDWRIARIKS
jgi:hypothetical protein